MGYIGLKSLAQIHEDGNKNVTGNSGKNAFALFPSFIDTGTSLVDKSNVDTYAQPAQ